MRVFICLIFFVTTILFDLTKCNEFEELPGAPENLKIVVIDDQSLNVSFESPSYGGDSPVLSYAVQWTLNEGQREVQRLTFGSDLGPNEIQGIDFSAPHFPEIQVIQTSVDTRGEIQVIILTAEQVFGGWFTLCFFDVFGESESSGYISPFATGLEMKKSLERISIFKSYVNITRKSNLACASCYTWEIYFDPLQGDVMLVEVDEIAILGENIDLWTEVVVHGSSISGTYSLVANENSFTVPYNAPAKWLEESLNEISYFGSFEVSRSAPNLVGVFTWVVTFHSSVDSFKIDLESDLLGENADVFLCTETLYVSSCGNGMRNRNYIRGFFSFSTLGVVLDYVPVNISSILLEKRINSALGESSVKVSKFVSDSNLLYRFEISFLKKLGSFELLEVVNTSLLVGSNISTRCYRIRNGTSLEQQIIEFNKSQAINETLYLIFNNKNVSWPVSLVNCFDIGLSLGIHLKKSWNMIGKITVEGRDVDNTTCSLKFIFFNSLEEQNLVSLHSSNGLVLADGTRVQSSSAIKLSGEVSLSISNSNTAYCAFPFSKDELEACLRPLTDVEVSCVPVLHSEMYIYAITFSETAGDIPSISAKLEGLDGTMPYFYSEELIKGQPPLFPFENQLVIQDSTSFPFVTVNGLTQGIRYFVRVYAVTSIGSSFPTYGSSLGYICSPQLASPPMISAFVDTYAATVDLKFIQPKFTGGGNILYYIVQWGVEKFVDKEIQLGAKFTTAPLVYMLNVTAKYVPEVQDISLKGPQTLVYDKQIFFCDSFSGSFKLNIGSATVEVDAMSELVDLRNALLDILFIRSINLSFIDSHTTQTSICAQSFLNSNLVQVLPKRILVTFLDVSYAGMLPLMTFNTEGLKGNRYVSAEKICEGQYLLGGFFRLSFIGFKSGLISFNATSSTIKEALTALPSVKSIVVVKKSHFNWVVTFSDINQSGNIPKILVDTTKLFGNPVYAEVCDENESRVSCMSQNGNSLHGTISFEVFGIRSKTVVYGAQPVAIKEAIEDISSVLSVSVSRQGPFFPSNSFLWYITFHGNNNCFPKAACVPRKVRFVANILGFDKNSNDVYTMESIVISPKPELAIASFVLNASGVLLDPFDLQTSASSLRDILKERYSDFEVTVDKVVDYKLEEIKWTLHFSYHLMNFKTIPIISIANFNSTWRSTPFFYTEEIKQFSPPVTSIVQEEIVAHSGKTISFKTVQGLREKNYFFRAATYTECSLKCSLCCGRGYFSSSMLQVSILASVPMPPSSIRLLGQSIAQFSLKINHPFNDGGAAVTNLEIWYRSIHNSDFLLLFKAGKPIFPYLFSSKTYLKLTNGLGYTVKARIGNKIGFSRFSDPVSVLAIETMVSGSPANLNIQPVLLVDSSIVQVYWPNILSFQGSKIKSIEYNLVQADKHKSYLSGKLSHIRYRIYSSSNMTYFLVGLKGKIFLHPLSTLETRFAFYLAGTLELAMLIDIVQMPSFIDLEFRYWSVYLDGFDQVSLIFANFSFSQTARGCCTGFISLKVTQFNYISFLVSSSNRFMKIKTLSELQNSSFLFSAFDDFSVRIYNAKNNSLLLNIFYTLPFDESAVFDSANVIVNTFYHSIQKPYIFIRRNNVKNVVTDSLGISYKIKTVRGESSNSGTVWLTCNKRPQLPVPIMKQINKDLTFVNNRNDFNILLVNYIELGSDTTVLKDSIQEISIIFSPSTKEVQEFKILLSYNKTFLLSYGHNSSVIRSTYSEDLVKKAFAEINYPEIEITIISSDTFVFWRITFPSFLGDVELPFVNYLVPFSVQELIKGREGASGTISIGLFDKITEDIDIYSSNIEVAAAIYKILPQGNIMVSTIFFIWS